jgi:peptide methionine sulfoxide reductase msrA/msrB
MDISSRYFLVFLLGGILLIYLSSTGINSVLGSDKSNSKENENGTMYNELTPEEEYVIINKGTEAPFSGDLLNNHDEGVYVCRQCGAALYRSEDKFDSHCGWPSFDDEIPGAIEKTSDADGIRTEITCANCGGHLGHVFYGEQLTDKNTRHCVNSISMDFILIDEYRAMRENPETGIQKAIFASGCFWGVEYHFNRADGVISTTVGYTGGSFEDPTYRQVCNGITGHAEAVEVTYDAGVTSYEDLLKLFFETHDFTQTNGQGPDIGAQYRSEIFYLSDWQKTIAEKLIGELSDKGYNVATHVTLAGTFWSAEDYHQDYYEKNGQSPYCHVYTQIF